MTMAHPVVRGAQVLSSDGHQIGEVGESRDDMFQVAVSMMPDYWLPMSCVTSADAVAVRLECSKDDVGNYKVAAPAAM